MSRDLFLHSSIEWVVCFLFPFILWSAENNHRVCNNRNHGALRCCGSKTDKSKFCWTLDQNTSPAGDLTTGITDPQQTDHSHHQPLTFHWTWLYGDWLSINILLLLFSRFVATRELLRELPSPNIKTANLIHPLLILLFDVCGQPQFNYKQNSLHVYCLRKSVAI